jgi:hypothetical protein
MNWKKEIPGYDDLSNIDLGNKVMEIDEAEALVMK